MAVNRGYSQKMRMHELEELNFNVTDGYCEYLTLDINQIKS